MAKNEFSNFQGLSYAELFGYYRGTTSEKIREEIRNEFIKRDVAFDYFFHPEKDLKGKGVAIDLVNAYFARQNAFCDIMNNSKYLRLYFGFDEDMDFSLYKSRYSKTSQKGKLKNIMELRTLSKANCDFTDYAESWKKMYDSQMRRKNNVATIDDDISRELKNVKKQVDNITTKQTSKTSVDSTQTLEKSSNKSDGKTHIQRETKQNNGEILDTKPITSTVKTERNEKLPINSTTTKHIEKASNIDTSFLNKVASGKTIAQKQPTSTKTTKGEVVIEFATQGENAWQTTLTKSNDDIDELKKREERAKKYSTSVKEFFVVQSNSTLSSTSEFKQDSTESNIPDNSNDTTKEMIFFEVFSNSSNQLEINTEKSQKKNETPPKKELTMFEIPTEME